MQTMEDRPEFPDEDDPANQADALGDGINPEGYFEELNGFLGQVAEDATAEDDEPTPDPTS